jgi:hypothetical protein
MGLLSSLFGSQNKSSMPPLDPGFYYDLAINVLPEGIYGKWKFDSPMDIIRQLSSPVQWKGFIAELFLKTALLFRPPMGGITEEWYGPDSVFLDNFTPRCGEFTDSLRYIVIPYPKPPPVSLPILGPHFSGIVYSIPDLHIRYYVLRQSGDPNNPSPTTMREILADGTNLNLGGGGVADFDVFLAWIRQRHETGGFIYGKA